MHHHHSSPAVDYTAVKTVFEFIEANAANQPGSIAIAAPGREPLSYARLRQQIQYIVQTLRHRGIGRNDPVAIVVNNGPEMAVAFLGVASAAASAPLNPAYSNDEFEYYLRDLEPKALLIEAGLKSVAAEIAHRSGIPVLELLPELDRPAGVFTIAGASGSDSGSNRFAAPDDIALLLHTSGTTSRPKIVPLTQSNICASAWNVSASLRLDESDRAINIMPLFHIHGLIGAVASSLVAGASVGCLPRFDAGQFFEFLNQIQATWFTAVPTLHHAILNYAKKSGLTACTKSLRVIRSSSSAMPLRLHREIEQAFDVPLVEAYGMTEASHQIACNPLPPAIRKPGTVGLAAGPDVAIMGEGGRLLNAGETGEIVIRGGNITPGYRHNPAANQDAFVNGWFRTGDQGFIDSEGYISISGRLKEIINRGGEKISPREIDEVLMTHPAVAQAVTFSMPHRTLGEDVGAAIVLHEGRDLSEKELREFARSKLAAFKVPSRVVFLKEIPKGPTGKLQRIGLASKLGLAEGFAAGSSPVPPGTPLEEALAGIWREVLGLDTFGVQDNFFQLGGNSVLAAQALIRIQDEIQVELPVPALFDNPTIAGLAIEIVRRQAELIEADEMAVILDELEKSSEEAGRPVAD